MILNSAMLAVFAAGLAAIETSPTQEASPVTPANMSEAACQLHVWPSNGLRSTYHGWLHGAIVDGAVTGRDGYPAMPADPLPAARQVELLKAASIAEKLKLADFAVTIHDAPLDSATARRTPGRLVPGAGDCYAELIFDDTFFQQDVVDGRFLKVLFRYRRFDAGNTPSRTFGSYAQVRLTAFPPKHPSGNVAARADLDAALITSIDEFGSALNAPPRKDKRRRTGTGSN